MEYISNSVKETSIFSRELIKKLNCNLICLYGELGAGKTTFVQGLAEALGIKKRILSPTFVLMRDYEIMCHASCIKRQEKKRDVCHMLLATCCLKHLYHIDLYRAESQNDVKSLNLEELWSDPKNLIIIEWAEKIKSILPKQRIDIKFSYEGESKRKISVVYRH